MSWRDWRPPTPPLPDHLQAVLKPDDPEWFVRELAIAAAHARGLQVHVWTVDTPEETTAMLDLGVDGIMTDRPAMLRQMLEARGQWTPR